LTLHSKQQHRLGRETSSPAAENLSIKHSLFSATSELAQIFRLCICDFVIWLELCLKGQCDFLFFT